MSGLRRLRGALLRLAYNRPAAVVSGVLLAAPAAWTLLTGHSWESAALRGIVFVAGATGAALVLAGVSGRRPDWID